MPAETRGKLPPGFTWQEVPQLKAAFPKLNGWFYRFETAPGNLACFITKENLKSTNPVLFYINQPEQHRQGINALINKVKSGQGFRTGLGVQCLLNFGRSLGLNPSALAYSALRDNAFFIPDGPIERLQNKALTIFRGTFRSGAKQLSELGMPPIHHYLLSAGNNKTGKLYLLDFETPEEFWDRDKKTAEIMIKNVSLNPRF